jgi:hypothetical protein
MVDLGFDGARGVEGLGLELFDIVHRSNRNITSCCYMWNMLLIRYI